MPALVTGFGAKAPWGSLHLEEAKWGKGGGACVVRGHTQNQNPQNLPPWLNLRGPSERYFWANYWTPPSSMNKSALFNRIEGSGRTGLGLRQAVWAPKTVLKSQELNHGCWPQSCPSPQNTPHPVANMIHTIWRVRSLQYKRSSRQHTSGRGNISNKHALTGMTENWRLRAHCGPGPVRPEPLSAESLHIAWYDDANKEPSCQRALFMAQSSSARVATTRQRRRRHFKEAVRMMEMVHLQAEYSALVTYWKDAIISSWGTTWGCPERGGVPLVGVGWWKWGSATKPNIWDFDNCEIINTYL